MNKAVRNNEPLSALTHFIGILLSIAGLVLMIIFGAIYGTAAHVVGYAIFGSSLILLYSASTIYHASSHCSTKKKLLQRFDHAMIFVLIAGTYTPVCLTLPQRGWGWSLFGVIWGLAAFGVFIKLCGVKLKSYVTVFIYLAMGWLIILAISPVMHWLNTRALIWLVIGGVSYSVGCIFFALDSKVPRTRWFGMHEVFHLFVIGGSFCHFWLMLQYISHL